MALTREWVNTDTGEYLVLAGTEGAILQHGEDTGGVALRGWILGWPWLLFRWYRRGAGRGRVEVRWRDQAWAWRTKDKHQAYVVGKRIQDLIASGAWIPMRTPQPDVPGAEMVWQA